MAPFRIKVIFYQQKWTFWDLELSPLKHPNFKPPFDFWWRIQGAKMVPFGIQSDIDRDRYLLEFSNRDCNWYFFKFKLRGPKTSFVILKRSRRDVKDEKSAWKILFLAWVTNFWKSGFACKYSMCKADKSQYWKLTFKVHLFVQQTC